MFCFAPEEKITTLLTNGPDVERAVLGPEGVLEGARKGSVKVRIPEELAGCIGPPGESPADRSDLPLRCLPSRHNLVHAAVRALRGSGPYLFLSERTRMLPPA